MTFRKYEISNASGFTWLGDIPSTWSVRPLRRFSCLVQTGPFGSQLHAEEYVTGATPVVNPVHMVDGRIRPSEDVTVGEEILDRLPHQRLQTGDVVFSRRGELGRCALVTETEAGWLCGTGSMILRLNETEYDPGYLSKYLSLDIIRQYFESFSIGAVMDSLSSATLLAMPMVVPPPDEQKTISSFLDVETSKIDGLVSEQRRLIELLKEKRQAVISHAVTKGLNPNAPMKPSGIQWLGDVPEHWEVKPLKYLATFRSGGTPSKTVPAYWHGDVPWASSKDLKTETLADTIDHITQHALDSDAATLIPAGSVLVVVRGMILLHTFPVVQTLTPMAINQDLKALTPAECIQESYLPWLLRGSTTATFGRIDEAAHGTKVLRMEAWTSIPLPVPPIEEQLEIVASMGAMLETLRQLKAEAERAIELLQERRTALISAAVTGKIDVRQFANVEAAS